MLLVKLATKSLLNRKASALLTLFTIAISVMLLMSIERVRVDAKSSFSNTISGTDLIVGARTGDIQLLLSSVFRIGHANNGVSWKSYQYISEQRGVKWAIPLSLGDSHKGLAVLGTNKDYFEQSLASLKSTLEDMAPHFRVLLLPVQFNKARGSSSIDELRMYCDEVDIIFLRKEVGSIDEFFLSLSRHLTSNAGYIDQLLKDRVWLRGPPERGLKMLLDEFSRVERLVENLSKDQKLRFIGMRHSSIVDELSVLGKLPIWAPDQEYEDGEVSSKGVAASLGNLASSAP